MDKEYDHAHQKIIYFDKNIAIMLNLSKKSPLNHSFFNQFMGLMCQNIVGSIIRYGIFMKIGSYMKLATPIAKRLLDNNLSLWDSKNGNQIKW
jgi:hypothetical protein